MDPALDRQIEKARKARSAKRRQQRQQLPRSWEEPFLAALAEGSHIQAACKAAGVHFVNLYRERRENPEFEAKVRQALSDSGRGFDGEARRMLLIRLNRGADFDDALASTGATRQQVEEAYAANPRLLKKLRPYLSGSGHGKAHRAQKLKCGCLRCRDYRNKAEQKRRARRRLERFPPQARQAFLDLVHNGVRVVDAAQQVGVPWQTVYTVASEDAEFGERLDAATRAHCTCGGTGRTGQGRQRCECPESRQTHAQETRRLRSAGAKQ
jgi:DNA-directed RNA polymerase specialized sigma24 family protein